MNNSYTALMIVVIASVTILLRFAPFLVFGNKRKTPELLDYLGKVLPYAMMGMLVVYCLRGIPFVAMPFGVPEIIACTVVVGLHVWKRNTLVSIFGGTVCYMMLVQLVF